MKRVLFAWLGDKDLTAAGLRRVTRRGSEVGTERSPTGPETSADDSSATPGQPVEVRREPDAGPIYAALSKRDFDILHLLTNFSRDETRRETEESAHLYVKWLSSRLQTLGRDVEVAVHVERLKSPTDHRDIYNAAIKVCTAVLERYGQDCRRTFHLSPGTPAMHAVWVIVSKTKIEADLLESYTKGKDQFVDDVSIPFDMAAHLIPENVAYRVVADHLSQRSHGVLPDLTPFNGIKSRSDAIAWIKKRAARVASFPAPVLLEGETGTGKELFAHAIHKASKRRGAFVAVNCGAIPADLVESELFGHEEGAFTGAIKARPGKFESADKGTLFLDELGEMPLGVQVKLLRVLQEHKVTRVGSTRQIPLDVRVIAATNRNLLEEVAAGRFREDLYYRIAFETLRLPPLRERKSDLDLLADAFLATSEEEFSLPHKKTLSAPARRVLLSHDWPGNVRELENTIKRAVLWSEDDEISELDIRHAIPAVPTRRPDDILQRPLGDGFSLADLIAEVERHYLSRAMQDAGGNKSKAASLVGFGSYQVLTNHLRKLGLDQ